jgi:hypothetical protein
MKFKQSNTLRHVALAGAITAAMAFSCAAGAANMKADTSEAQSPLMLTTPVRSPDVNAPLGLSGLAGVGTGIVKPTAAQPVNTALVNSCADAWYFRSLIEELGCGFSGQGWYN